VSFFCFRTDESLTETYYRRKQKNIKTQKPRKTKPRDRDRLSRVTRIIPTRAQIVSLEGEQKYLTELSLYPMVWAFLLDR
jgi:hypothetical protein